MRSLKEFYSGNLPWALEGIWQAERMIRDGKVAGLSIDYQARYAVKDGTGSLIIPPYFSGIFLSALNQGEGDRAEDELSYWTKLSDNEFFNLYKVHRTLRDEHSLAIAEFEPIQEAIACLDAFAQLFYSRRNLLPTLIWFYGKVPKKVADKWQKRMTKITGEEYTFEDPELDYSYKIGAFTTMAQQIHKEITGEENEATQKDNELV